jgi:uncharacterized protein (PEP-CTERM system associated)
MGCLCITPGAHAERWTLSAAAGASEAYNHYSGPGSTSDGTTTSINGSIAFNGEGARVKLRGTLSATESYYAGQGQGSASFAPGANVVGQVEAIEKFFFVDATANVSQTYATPFGPQPAGLAIPTTNRYTAESYSVSPYIKGVLGGKVGYLVRDDNVWSTSSNYGDSAFKPPSTYSNSLLAELNSVESGRTSWDAQYTRQTYDSGVDTGRYVLELARGILSYTVDPQLQVSGRGGYERDSFAQQSTIGNDTKGGFYGAGAHWRPTERTDVNGFWEHHYYGSAYSWTVSHRLPNVALSAAFTRGLNSYPQLALIIPAGVPVTQFLDLAFTTRIPDPLARAQAVAQFLANSGLPPTLLSPLNVYSSSVTLQETATLGAAWIGVLNSVALSLFRSDSRAAAGQGSLPPELQLASNSVQTGGSVSYTHRLTGFTNFVASLGYSQARPNAGDQNVEDGLTRNYNASAALSTNFSPKTSGSVGLSYFTFDSPGTNGRPSTLSLFASINHTF